MVIGFTKLVIEMNFFREGGLPSARRKNRQQHVKRRLEGKPPYSMCMFQLPFFCLLMKADNHNYSLGCWIKIAVDKGNHFSKIDT